MDSNPNSSEETNDVTKVAATLKGQLAPFGVSAAATTMGFLGGAIMISTVMTTSSSKFPAELFPGLVRAALAGLLVGCSALLNQRKEFARQLALVVFPIGIVAVGAAYPRLLWTADIPLTLLGFLLYAPLAFFLTRAKAVLYFRHNPCGWIGRGGVIVMVAFILTLLCAMISPETLTKPFLIGSESYMVCQVAIIVLLVHYATGMAAIGIPTRYDLKLHPTVAFSDKIGAVATFAILLMLILLRVYRPDLSGTGGLTRLTNIKLVGECKVVQFNVGGFDEQQANWILEHPKINLLDVLKNQGYQELSPQEDPDAQWLSNAAMQSTFFSGGTGVKILAGGKSPPQVTATKWYHFVALSADGRYSLHRVYLWAMP